MEQGWTIDLDPHGYSGMKSALNPAGQQGRYYYLRASGRWQTPPGGESERLCCTQHTDHRRQRWRTGHTPSGELGAAPLLPTLVLLCQGASERFNTSPSLSKNKNTKKTKQQHIPSKKRKKYQTQKTHVGSQRQDQKDKTIQNPKNRMKNQAPGTQFISR